MKSDENVIEMKTLSNKRHLMFCLYYLDGLNATESYKKAYNTNNERSAGAAASLLLKRDDINDFLDYCILNNLEKVGIKLDPSKIVLKLWEIAMAPTYENPAQQIRALEILFNSLRLNDENSNLIENLESVKISMAHRIKMSKQERTKNALLIKKQKKLEIEAILEAMEYRDVQDIAKDYGIKANLGKSDIIKGIVEHTIEGDDK